MTSPRVLALACVALLSSPLAAQTSAPQTKIEQDLEFLKGAYHPGVGGVRAPTVVKEVKPTYTSEAMRQKIQGSVELQIVVGVDGSVVRARVMKSLDKDYGLDASALDAVRAWRFNPGTLDARAVPVVVNVDLEFKLHSCGPLGCGFDGFVPPTVPVAARQVDVSSAPRVNEDDDFLKGVYAVGASGVRAPTVVTEVKPSYTPEAMRQKVQGAVEVQIVVGVDGSVMRARVTKSLDRNFGLDAAALESASRWKFRPAMLDGEAVPVVVTLHLEFRLSR